MRPPESTPGQRAADYEYDLPPDRVARYPCERRDGSRLLVVPRAPAPVEHHTFRHVLDLMRAGDVMVVNESRVLPARLLGRKPTGAPSEILLLRPWVGDGPADVNALGTAFLWEALVRPGGKLKPGRTVVVAEDLRVDILDSVPGGGRLVRLVTSLSPLEALQRYGHVPLPPYIDREDEALDRERYQTVYARVPGSVAAPTAGLHFTEELLAEARARGVAVTAVTLHVGMGTFRPVDAEDLSGHEMHAEHYTVPAGAAAAVAGAREAGGRVWAVGTTVVRTLEAVARAGGPLRAATGSTRLFIRPPFDFRVVDGLITNFHLPRSTLLMLVAAFAGYERTMAAYREAVDRGYRFYSYGDAMALVRGQEAGRSRTGV
ncbi:MAG TPA: tRNA preQ1(34) S-adenosylmethionine ribosyltransferase-isomerase QueA [Longimicrobiales bacterium]